MGAKEPHKSTLLALQTLQTTVVEKLVALLSRDGVVGVNVDCMTNRDSTNPRTNAQQLVQELRGVLKVVDHEDGLQKLHKLWKAEEMEATDVLVKLQELAGAQETPFEWV